MYNNYITVSEIFIYLPTETLSDSVEFMGAMRINLLLSICLLTGHF